MDARKNHNHKCEFCSNDAQFKAQIMKEVYKKRVGTQMYWYACSKDCNKLDAIDYLADKELIKSEGY